MDFKIFEFIRRFIMKMIAIVSFVFEGSSFKKFLFFLRTKNNFINLTKEKNFKLKTFNYVNYNFNLDFYRRILEEILFEEDLTKSVIAGGCFSNYIHNNLSLDFPDLFKLICEQKDVDIYIETRNFAKYKKKFKTRIFKNKKNYPFLFYSMKFIWKDIKINFIFSKNTMTLIENFDLDFSKIFYSYSKNSIYAYCTLFELFDSEMFNILNEGNFQPSYLWYYEKRLLEKRILYFFPERKFLSDNFIRYDLCRYTKYAFKGFYEKEEEKKIKNMIAYYENVLTQFLK